MKNKLEQLLNSLIEKGWKPYGIDKDDIEVFEYNKDRKNISIGYMNWVSPSEGDYDWLFMSLRELTSKESGLWQFVCENKMVDREHKRPAYRIIESALCDEDKLEEFLLSNISVEGTI